MFRDTMDVKYIIIHVDGEKKAITLKNVSEDIIKELKDFGLMGIEAYYTEHSPEFTKVLLEYAKEFGFLVTGGSDFHGANKPDIKLGKGLGNLRVPFECYANLVKALEKL